MHLGFSLPIAGDWARPDNQVTVARAAEHFGYHSLWVFRRLLYALAPKNEYPPAPGPAWPPAFQRVVDPIVTLAWAAAHTRHIRLGASVLITPFYTPVALAKQLATLDHVSGGRLDVGLGLGWSKDEYEAVGVPFRDRGRRGDEFLSCLEMVWTQGPVEFEGEFYRVPRSQVEPKPLQKRHPPLTVGRYSPVVVQRVVTLADGFSGGNMPLDEVTKVIVALHEAAAAAGRDPATLQVVCRGSYQASTARRAPAAGRSGGRSTRCGKTSPATPLPD
jgi:probable F420-dependent oxidoreductase